MLFIEYSKYVQKYTEYIHQPKMAHLDADIYRIIYRISFPKNSFGTESQNGGCTHLDDYILASHTYASHAN